MMILFKNESAHFGVGYKIYNTKYWNSLKKELLGGSTYNHIIEFAISKNGRGVCAKLLSAYEGSDFSDRQRNDTFAALAKASYRGESKKSAFKKYEVKHAILVCLKQDITSVEASQMSML